jgi:hypothetical protein
LPAEDRQLVPEHENLEFLRTVGAGEQHQKPQQPTDDEVERRYKQWRPPETGEPTLQTLAELAPTTPTEFPHPTGSDEEGRR